MNTPTKHIYIGAPVLGDEARFLHELYRDLGDLDAIILANFFIKSRQFDFVLITRTSVAILELKCLSGPVYGGENGNWYLQSAAGQRVSYGSNPFSQTLDQKFALSDAMGEFQRKTVGVPPPVGKKFVNDVQAFVCLYPVLDPTSSISVSEYKVEVAGYDVIRTRLRSLESNCQWSLETWHEFARSRNLTAATIDGATDPAFQRADEEQERYRERLRSTVREGLAPLLVSPDDRQGVRLVERLRERRNWLLLGPSGSAKSFHIEHFAVAVTDTDNELPLLLRARHFEGGAFASFLSRELAPYTTADASTLIAATLRSGRRPLLIVDALNECAEAHLPDLLRSIQAFVLRYGARVVMASQLPVDLPSELKAQLVYMPLPDASAKRAIYAYHAGVEESKALDALCSGFTNAYDLVIAGRCHSDGPQPQGRAHLYDRYIRASLRGNALSGAALLRRVASEMSSEVSFSLGRARFDEVAEAFSREEGVPLHVVDSVTRSGLLLFAADSVFFEHELLQSYFAAQALQQQTAEPATLALELNRARHRNLRDFILPRIDDRAEISTMLTASTDVGFLVRVANGECGDRARDVIIDECLAVLEEAALELPSLTLTCESAEVDGRRRLTTVTLNREKPISARTNLIHDVIGRSLEDPRLLSRVISLVDETGSTLRRISDEAARESRFNAVGVWATVLHHMFVLRGGKSALPCATILNALKDWSSWGRDDRAGVAARRAIAALAYRPKRCDIAVLYTFEFPRRFDRDDDIDLAADLRLVEYAWNTGIYILRINALQFIEQQSAIIHERFESDLPAVRELLASFQTKNIWESTSLVDALSAYDALDGLPSAGEAAAEMQGIITGVHLNDNDMEALTSLSGTTPTELRSNAAYSAIAKMFEGPFGDAYSHAYNALTDDDRYALLALALDRKDDIGTHTPWMLTELLRLQRQSALPIFRRFAEALPVRERSFSAQEDVARYMLGLKGCALWMERPPNIRAGSTAIEQAWRVMGEIIFWYYRFGASAVGATNELWATLSDSTIAAGLISDVVAGNVLLYSDDLKVDFVKVWPDQVRVVAERFLESGREAEALTAFRRSDAPGLMIRFLAQVGDNRSLPALRGLLDDAAFGTHALAAISAIQKAPPQGMGRRR